MKPTWIFGNNDTRENEGPNNSGITNFTDDRIGGLVREIIQNSIDARLSDTKSVEVDFVLKDLPTTHLDLAGLKQSMVASRKSHAIDDRHKVQFRRGIKTLDRAVKKGTINALTVTDKNTTGASDKKDQRDKWHSLTKTVGLSTKDTRDSGGSFGVGKHAAFAVTDLRTVLYSTAYREDGTAGSIRRRFTGKSILVSHKVEDNEYRASGWLEAAGGPLRDRDIPKEFRLKSPGTEINILGFGDSHNDEWRVEARESLAKHFFHALARNNLRVRIGESAIDADSLDDVVTDMDDGLHKLIAVSRSKIRDHTDIEGIGRVNLRIHLDSDSDRGEKTIALVRDAGMLITSQLNNMRITPSQRMIRIPRPWLGFTAIVECLSQGEKSLLREAEGARHDRVSSDNADSSERKEVARALRRLGNWVVNTIEKYAKPPEPTTSDNAEEMAAFLPLEGNGARTSFDPGQGHWEITEPQQSPAAPRGLRTPGRNRRRTTRITIGGSDPGTPNGNGKKKRKRTSGRRSEPIEVSFHDLRRLPTTLSQWPEHSARFAFDRPQGSMKSVRLYAVGEDSVNGTQVLLERAYIDGRKLSVKGGEIVEIPQDRMSQDRVHIELKAIRPIADKRLEIRFMHRDVTKK